MVFDRILFSFVFLLFIPSAVYIPDSNSWWVAPSFDLLFALGGALLLAANWRSAPLRRVVVTPTVRGLAGACVLLALPVLFTRPEWQSAAIWRLAALCAWVAFYFTWLQLRMTARQRHRALYLVLFVALMQAVLVPLGVVCIEHCRCVVAARCSSRLRHFSATERNGKLSRLRPSAGVAACWQHA
ncbi:hypothetical protein WIA58_09450 [Serratia marcescens]|uniref:hypothetical protein n=1 Tax=Serratia marcescens TaxID=615 RepID=UPI00339C1785